MPTSTYPLWVADQKYARAAQFLGLTDEEAKNGETPTREKMCVLLRRAVYDLARLAGQPLSVAELGIPQDQYEQRMVELVTGSFEDMSMRTNPALPLIPEVAGLLAGAYAPRQRP